MENIREEVKELWNTTRKPYVEIGLLLNIMRKQKLYLTWGYRDIQEYIADIHIPHTNYGLYISIVKHLIRLNLTVGEGLKIERDYTIKRVISTARVSKTKDELFQRLTKTYQQEVTRKKYLLGPFTLSLREIDRVWRAKRIAGDATRKFEKSDLLKLADYMISKNRG